MNNTTTSMILMNKDFMNIQDIAEAYGISRQAVSERFKRAGYQVLRFPREGRDKHLLTCKQELQSVVDVSYNYTQVGRFTDVKASVAKAWIDFHGVDTSNFSYKGEHASCFTGGRTLTKKGYITTNCNMIGYDSFNPNWRSHGVLEHKAFVEMKLLGRVLPEGYVIHHINEKPADNDMSNLSVLTRGEHSRIHAMLRKIERALEKSVDAQAIAESIDQLTEYVELLSKTNIKAIKLGCRDYTDILHPDLFA